MLLLLFEDGECMNACIVGLATLSRDDAATGNGICGRDWNIAFDAAAIVAALPRRTAAAPGGGLGCDDDCGV